MALTVAQAFTVAFELWQEAKEGRKLWRSWVISDCRFSTADVKNLLLCPDLCVVSLGSCLCILEKVKRAKSGSAGEASGSSYSERSDSLGSLKGTGGTFYVSFLYIVYDNTIQNNTQHPLGIISHFWCLWWLWKGWAIFLLTSSSYLSDVTTDNLLDLEDTVKAVMEANGNLPEDQLDNRRCESNNNAAWVSLLHTLYPLPLAFEGGEFQTSSSPLHCSLNHQYHPSQRWIKLQTRADECLKSAFGVFGILAKPLFSAKEGALIFCFFVCFFFSRKQKMVWMKHFPGETDNCVFYWN